MIRKLLNWFVNLFKGKNSVDDSPGVSTSGEVIAGSYYSYAFVDDVPDTVDDNMLYLIGNEAYYWQALMKCPCGCNADISLNLIPDYKPYWTYHFNDRKEVSLSPSIDRLVGCKSHYFLRSGKIVWSGSLLNPSE